MPASACSLRRLRSTFATVAALSVLVAPAKAQVPWEPTEDEIEAALSDHHAKIQQRGFEGDGYAVWFIVNVEGEVLETGAGELDGLEQQLIDARPEIVWMSILELEHITVFGVALIVVWMVPES